VGGGGVDILLGASNHFCASVEDHPTSMGHPVSRWRTHGGGDGDYRPRTGEVERLPS